MSSVSLNRARLAKQAALRLCSNIQTVVGVGITRVRDDYAVKINLSEPLPPGKELPTSIDGVPVRIEITGTTRAL